MAWAIGGAVVIIGGVTVYSVARAGKIISRWIK